MNWSDFLIKKAISLRRIIIKAQFLTKEKLIIFFFAY